MERTAIVSWGLIVLAWITVAAGGATVEFERSKPDPERQARVALWWRQFAAAEPALAETRATLARAHRLWRAVRSEGPCAEARTRLDRIDRHALLEGAAYPVALEVDRVFDALTDATRACVDRRYFEFGYRLDLARDSLARIELLRHQMLDP